MRQHYLYIYTRDITNTQLVGGLKSIKNTTWDDNNISSLLGMIITDHFFPQGVDTTLSLILYIYRLNTSKDVHLYSIDSSLVNSTKEGLLRRHSILGKEVALQDFSPLHPRDFPLPELATGKSFAIGGSLVDCRLPCLITRGYWNPMGKPGHPGFLRFLSRTWH